MNRPFLATLTLSSALFAGCAATPESVCETFIKSRKSGELPAGEAVQKECVTELAALQKRSPEAFECVKKCIGTESVGISAEHSAICITNSCADKDAETKSGDRWSQGIAAKASGAWANEKLKKLSAEQCNEGSYAISGMKYRLGILADSYKRDSHKAELLKACKESSDDAAYAEQFACLRRVTKQDEILKCAQPTSGK